jgi:WhiB family redox-sensing transcriptional regulator
MGTHKHWREHAACIGVGVEVFFPNSKGAGDERWELAKAICQNCIVRRQCLELALQSEEHDDRWGVFGGLTPLERRSVRDKKKAKAKAS